MLKHRTSVGGLLLEVGEGWKFSLRDGAIAGRFGAEPGVLRITFVSLEKLAQPMTPDGLWDAMARIAQVPEIKASERSISPSITGPFGSANFRRGKDVVGMWFCTRAPGLIVGVYASPGNVTGAAMQHHRWICGQCAKMVTSAVFDRPAWGGDDVLTRFMTEQMKEEGAAGGAKEKRIDRK